MSSPSSRGGERGAEGSKEERMKIFRAMAVNKAADSHRRQRWRLVWAASGRWASSGEEV